ncbi:YutD family protein [Paenibacillus selenitireducens]|uniref:YutD family protein n=1 Tax=Paenibacillus selenitireducens TaxID=1324314 RepID=UPI000996451D|nr:YutD family protein [Paenibacillus selenitireducens]
MIHITGKTYEVMTDHKNGWNAEAFKDRYSDVLDRYDYIIGDWGYNQLRLKGFFRDNNPKSTKDSNYSSMIDYINEYCNFGCAYFVLEKMKEQKGDKGQQPQGAPQAEQPAQQENQQASEQAAPNPPASNPTKKQAAQEQTPKVQQTVEASE